MHECTLHRSPLGSTIFLIGKVNVYFSVYRNDIKDAKGTQQTLMICGSRLFYGNLKGCAKTEIVHHEY